jgi:hypothetical protein
MGEVVTVTTTHGSDSIVCHLTALPFRDDAFVYTRCVDALERLADPSTGVHELARVTRSGARVDVAAVNRNDARQFLRRQHGGHPSSRHLHRFGWRDLERLIGSDFAIEARLNVRQGTSLKSAAFATLVRLPFGERLSPKIVFQARRR